MQCTTVTLLPSLQCLPIMESITLQPSPILSVCRCEHWTRVNERYSEMSTNKKWNGNEAKTKKAPAGHRERKTDIPGQEDLALELTEARQVDSLHPKIGKAEASTTHPNKSRKIKRCQNQKDHKDTSQTISKRWNNALRNMRTQNTKLRTLTNTLREQSHTAANMKVCCEECRHGVDTDANWWRWWHQCITPNKVVHSFAKGGSSANWCSCLQVSKGTRCSGTTSRTGAP